MTDRPQLPSSRENDARLQYIDNLIKQRDAFKARGDDSYARQCEALIRSAQRNGQDVHPYYQPWLEMMGP